METLLITGALGHIGSSLIHSIKPNEFNEVILLDNMYTQRFPSLFNLPKGVNFRFIEGDVMTIDLKKILKGVNVVIHLAAITNAEGSFDIQEKVEQVNFDGTRRVAEACIENGTKLIFLSTTSVYGTQDEVVDETASEKELRPQSPYAKSKFKGEKLLAEMGQKNNLKFVSCRFGTIFGTSIGMRFHTAVNKFIWQACTGMPITVWRTAFNQKRPYLSLSDAVAALRFIISENVFDNEVYNVLTVNSTVGEIVEAIREVVPDLEISYVDSRIMNQLSYTVACEKFQSLGFRFKGSLRRDVRETFNLLQNVRQENRQFVNRS
jgi:nucleoside-diphosphate-sugar epimerase